MQIFAVGGPHFASSIASTISGRELIIMDYEFAKQKYLIRECMLSELEFEQFNSFFRARKGMAIAFRFRDPMDYKVVRQQIAVGDDKQRSFPLVKLYEDKISTYCRRITKPVERSVRLFKNNTEIFPNIDYDKGIIKLDSPLMFNEILVADFMFDVVVRFGADSFDYRFAKSGTVVLSDIELIEVIE